jgi:twitching motility protein PilT
MKLYELMEKMITENASDLHITTGLKPGMRINGKLSYLDMEIISKEMVDEMVNILADNKLKHTLQEDGQVDLAFSFQNRARFRINIYRQSGLNAIAIRYIPFNVPERAELKLPDTIYKLADEKRGLVLVTGPTGSGKSTTLASMVDYINKEKDGHIITLEDPVEFCHKSRNCIINQREIGRDTRSYALALRGALREDPDTILIGEMRDKETIAAAITAAETGHLVLSTLHTLGSAKTVDRIIDVFEPHQQPQIRAQLSTVLKGIISQQLVRTIDKKRVVATEIMLMVPAISNMIREGKTTQINSSIHTGLGTGMHSMEFCLKGLYENGVIDYNTACETALNRDSFERLF